MSQQKRNMNKKIIILCGILLIAILIIFLLVNSSKKSKLSKFEEITIYGYLENFLSPSKLHYLAGNSNLDNLQYTQVYVKKAIDKYTSENSSTTIPTSAIMSELSQNDLLKDTKIDFHGIAIPDYVYSAEEDAYIKTPGANAGLTFIDSNNINIAESEEAINITKIEKLKDDKYKVYFDLINTATSSKINTGEVVLLVTEDSQLNIESCSI